jgi:hypothetical protein
MLDVLKSAYIRLAKFLDDADAKIAISAQFDFDLPLLPFRVPTILKSKHELLVKLLLN